MTIAQRVAVFQFVRDIPYHIGLNDADANYNCVSKAEMLGQMLAGIGIKSRPIICTFDWTETPLPADLLAMPRDPGETHQFLQVFVPRTKQWVNVDPTWDKKLTSAGFAIAEWNGQTDTILAVKPHVIYSPNDTLRVMAEENNPDIAAKHMVKHTPFYNGINQWLQKQRALHY